MPTLNEIFDPHSGHGELTEEYIYDNQPAGSNEPRIEVLSSSTSDLTSMGVISRKTVLPDETQINIFDEPCILVARNGTYAGQIRFIKGQAFAITDHAYVLTPKPEWKEKILLEWFFYRHRHIFKPFITGRNGNATFALDFLDRIEIEVPKTDQQAQLVQKMRRLEKHLQVIKRMRQTIHDLMEEKISTAGMSVQDETINRLFKFISGNHALTEETIYNQAPAENSKIPIFSGSSDNETPLGYIKDGGVNKHGVPLQYFDGERIILTKDGSSGQLTYKSGEKFTCNHHAGVLVLRDKWAGRLLPRWVAHQYEHDLLQYVTSRSDNRVLSSEWFKRVKFRFPNVTVQERQLQKLGRLKEVDSRLARIQEEGEKLISLCALPSASSSASALSRDG